MHRVNVSLYAAAFTLFIAAGKLAYYKIGCCDLMRGGARTASWRLKWARLFLRLTLAVFHPPALTLPRQTLRPRTRLIPCKAATPQLTIVSRFTPHVSRFLGAMREQSRSSFSASCSSPGTGGPPTLYPRRSILDRPASHRRKRRPISMLSSRPTAHCIRRTSSIDSRRKASPRRPNIGSRRTPSCCLPSFSSIRASWQPRTEAGSGID